MSTKKLTRQSLLVKDAIWKVFKNNPHVQFNKVSGELIAVASAVLGGKRVTEQRMNNVLNALYAERKDVLERVVIRATVPVWHYGIMTSYTREANVYHFKYFPGGVPKADPDTKLWYTRPDQLLPLNLRPQIGKLLNNWGATGCLYANGFGR